MRTADHVDSLLGELSHTLGIGNLQLEENICTLDFGDLTQLVIEVPEASDMVVLYAPIHPLPTDTEQCAELFGQLLSAHLFGSQTNGAWFAIREDEIVLNLPLAMEGMDAQSFENTIENFLTSVSEWEQRLREGFPEDGEDEGSSSMKEDEDLSAFAMQV